jgi:hypothetical protein
VERNKQIKWVQYDEDVLEMVRMLVAYFKRDATCGRSPVSQNAIKKAARILGAHAYSDTAEHSTGRRRKQYLGKAWRERLETAGINPDTLEVENRKRWALSWEMLRDTGEWWPERIENSYRCKWFVDPDEEFRPLQISIEPSTAAQRVEEKRRVKAQEQANGYLSARLRERNVSL